MSRWTDEELPELVTLWPTSSASEIGKRLHRLPSAISRKATRLRQVGLLPPGLPKHFEVNPLKRLRPKPRPKKPPPPVGDYPLL
jgi:GcrA cell cycle regulator